MIHDESRPRGTAPESATTNPILADLNDIHAAYGAGQCDGYTAGRQAASVDLARQWLHDLANDFEALAISNAAAKGPHWQAAMRDQATGGAA